MMFRWPMKLWHISSVLTDTELWKLMTTILTSVVIIRIAVLSKLPRVRSISVYTHTFIIGNYNPSVRIMKKLFAPHMPCEWCDLKFKDGTERQIFEKVFVAIVFTETEICWEEVAEEIFFLCRFIGNVCPGDWTVASCLKAKMTKNRPAIITKSER